MPTPRRKRARMEGFDYSTPGSYFVTINAQSRSPWFGTVVNGVLHPNPAAHMVLRVWDDLPSMFPGIMVDTVVIMPDHMHGIVMLGTDPDTLHVPTLSSVIGAFKSLTTVEYGRGVRSEGWRPYDRHLWHRTFRDTIIRSDQALEAFRDYIEANPAMWSESMDNVIELSGALSSPVATGAS